MCWMILCHADCEGGALSGEQG
ncbi:unnamed protein product [Ectocarpus sp. CCAP 1310/34]|nr:unnamed protein product [Ectocarpus sp. CCAP 1310/34]